MSSNFVIRLVFILAFTVSGFQLSLAQGQQGRDMLLEILEKEMVRQMEIYGSKPDPVYLMSYRVDEVRSYDINAIFGNLSYADSSLTRILTIQIRLGSPDMDNYHELRDDASDYFTYRQFITLPLDNHSRAIEQTLWRETDIAYQEAVKRLEKVKANVAVKVEADDKSPDYSEVYHSLYYEEPEVITVDVREWGNKLKKYSSFFARERAILEGGATARFTFERKYFVNSEGTSIVQNQNYAHLNVSAKTQADDGMELPLYSGYFGHYPEELPEDYIIEGDIKKMVNTLLELRDAPIVDSYTGPAMLTSEAAGVFFHEIFGHRVEGQRMKSENDGQTFKKKVGEQVLNPDISVIFDPTISHYENIPLNGSYKFDDEGTRSEKVVVVDKGILKNFLMTRTPIDNFPKTNGHARAQSGYQPVSRQSNLIVKTENPYTDEQLKEMLLREVKAQGKEYGYIFHKVQGGFTMTGRYYPNSFNVTPLEVYRVYADGREDELVRGVDLVGTPLSMFSQIEGIGDKAGNFAGTCGAESGGIPVGCCSPALFVKRIEVQKKSKAQSKPPVVERFYEESRLYEEADFETMAFEAMKDEIAYNMENLRIDGLQNPYFISYLVTDARLMAAESKLGGLTHSIDKPYRNQETKVLVGNNEKNNLNFIDENSIFGSGGSFYIPVPTENKYNGIRNSLWLTTDSRYKRSAEMMETKKIAIRQQNLSPEITGLPDLSEVENKTYEIAGSNEYFLQSDIENIAKELSRIFEHYPHLTNSGASVYAYSAKALYLNSDGMKYTQPFSLMAVRVYAETLTEDGEPLMNYFTSYYPSYQDIPPIYELSEKTREMAELLETLRKSPRVEESYSGPVMFTGEAVGEIVAQAFLDNSQGLVAGRKNITSNPDLMRWYGQYLPKENTLENLKGKKVISRNISIKAVDGKSTFQDVPLIGFYQVDAEGVKPPGELELIKEGVLENLLTDRIPTSRFNESNGHKRLALSAGRLTTSLSAGVIEMTGKSKTSYAKIKKKLIAMAKEEDYEYAYIVPKIVSPTSNVPGLDQYRTRDGYYHPLYVIRISVKDGSETVMRSARLSALSLKSFKQAVAVSNHQQVYNTLLKGNNGMYIRGSYEFNISGVPASIITPDAILFRELELEKDQQVILRTQPEIKNPLLP